MINSSHNKNKIYYLTRTYSPYQKGGGALMRAGAVKYLQESGWEVIVVLPNYGSKEVSIEHTIIRTPLKHIRKLSTLFQLTGIYEDYLDKWVNSSFEYLKTRIKKEDIIFSTSGGDLATIKLGSLLKKETGCHFVVNYRDPINFSLVHGLKVNKTFHVSREKKEKRYLSNSDLIITSSLSNKSSLENKYPNFSSKIKNNYFGFINKVNQSSLAATESEKINIAYIGSMTSTQKPEILYNLYKNFPNNNSINIYFIGDRDNYKPLHDINDTNIKFIDFLPAAELLEFTLKHIDIGFVSLSRDYFGACVPSKIYEYINFGLPILGALPDGDAKNIINDNHYGIATHYNDTQGLLHAVEQLSNRSHLERFRSKILKDRDQWFMKNKMQEVDLLLRKL